MGQLAQVPLQTCLSNLTDREPIWEAAIQNWPKQITNSLFGSPCKVLIIVIMLIPVGESIEYRFFTVFVNVYSSTALE